MTTTTTKNNKLSTMGTQLAVQQPSPQVLAMQTALKSVSKSIAASLKENAGTFNASLMELVTSDPKLLACNPTALMAEAVKAASIKLPLNKQLGYAYLLPFGTTPTLVIGYRGYIQLAMRTGQYRYINADIVYEGELTHKDKLTGAISLDGEKTSDNVVGYFAHFELINGCCKTLYMTVEEMANYALKFSPSFKVGKQTAENLIKRAQEQAVKGPEGGVGWWANFNAMAQKTVLRRLLSKYGFLSIEMMNAIASDEPTVISAEAVRDADNAAPRPVLNSSQLLQDADATEVKDTAPVEQPPI